MEPSGLNREQWLEKLFKIDQHLQQHNASAQLTLVGSAAGIFAGQPERTSIDLDVWKPTSSYVLPALKSAVEAVGLLFDPKSTLEPETPYLQLIEPGIVQMGKFRKPDMLEQFQALRLQRPPIANLVASKLTRVEPKDLEDIAFLLSTFRPSREDIVKAIQSMPLPSRDTAIENLIYLDTLSGNEKDLRL